jgi:hypothetical protein
MGAVSRRVALLGQRFLAPMLTAMQEHISNDLGHRVDAQAEVARRELQERSREQYEATRQALHDDLRAEMVEVARMLRMQGDADDELAETLGRTLTRLSAEVEGLSTAVAHLEAADPWRDQPVEMP